MKKRRNSSSELEKVRVGMIMSGVMLLGSVMFGLAGLWIIAVAILVLLSLILVVSFIVSLFPKIHKKEYNELNPIQKIFSTASYILEIIGYLSPIGG